MVQNQAQAAACTTSAAVAATKTTLRTKSGLGSSFPLSSIGVATSTAATPRRLSENRRLQRYRVTTVYTIDVPAGHSVSATAVSSSLGSVSASAWTTAMATAAGIPASSISGLTATAPTVANVAEVSLTKSTSLLVGSVMILRFLM